MKKQIIQSAVFLLLLSLCLSAAGNILKAKAGFKGKRPYFEDTLPVDVLFAGSSHMHESVDPMYLWDEFGITSYNLASAGESMQLTYYVIRAAFEHQIPKAVVLDSFKIEDQADDIGEGDAFIHQSIDPLPWGRAKAEACLYAGRYVDGGLFSMLSNIYSFHKRYGELEEGDFHLLPNLDKGAYIMTTAVSVRKPEYFSDSAGQLKGGDGVKAYMETLKLCREHGVECVLGNFPGSAGMYTEERMALNNALMEYTLKEGFNVINFNEKKIRDTLDLDYDYEFGDLTHLNIIGAEKVSDLVGRYLIENFGVEDHRGDGAFVKWEEDRRKWTREKLRLLDEIDEPVHYLLQSYDKYLFSEVFVSEPGYIDKAYGLVHSMDYMGIEAVVSEDEELMGKSHMVITVRDRKGGEILKKAGFAYNSLSRALERSP